FLVVSDWEPYLGSLSFALYHLKDVIVGKIYFLLVRIKIQHMELQLIKKEMTGIGEMRRVQFLAGYDLTATMRDVNKKFSVRYFLNLVLVDEEDRRYFKQQVQNIKHRLEPELTSLERPENSCAATLPIQPDRT
uniref:Uncharacterized protein n=1 Tax=Oncorhynchus kisutch TaxID=8019 RepID=A0A8C7LIC7_ONCKI